MSGEASSLSEYCIIAHNGLLHHDLGVVVSRVVVVAAVHDDSASGAQRYCFTFLWKLDSEKSVSIGLGGDYSVESRQYDFEMFRLCKVDVVFHDQDVHLVEQSMLSAGTAYTAVRFVEEFVISPHSDTMVQRKMLYEQHSRFPQTNYVVGCSSVALPGVGGSRVTLHDDLMEAASEDSDDDIAG